MTIKNQLFGGKEVIDTILDFDCVSKALSVQTILTKTRFNEKNLNIFSSI